MHIMTVDLVAIAAAVDAAVSPGTRSAWERSSRRLPGHLFRGRVFLACGRPYAHLVGSRCDLPTQSAGGPQGCGAEPLRAHRDERAVASDLRSAFRDLGAGADDMALFVSVGREFLAGDLPVPRAPGRVVVEVDGAHGDDSVVRDGLLRLKAMGCRVALGGFTGRRDQRALLPLADFVKIDSRDLDVEGRPLLDLAASRGADLVAEHVDTDAAVAQCRAAGIPLLQGRALERQSPVRRPRALASPSGR